jgi:tRNA pseudouridine synthase 10
MDNISFDSKLLRQESLLHEFQFRDRIKSAEYHFATPFEFDGFFDEKEIVGGLFEKICFLSRELEFSSFKVGVSWPFGLGEAEKGHLKLAIQSALIALVSKKLGKESNFSFPEAEFLIDFNKKLVLVRVNPVFVRGKYCKYSREVAQTEFFCNKCRGKGCWYCKDTGHFSKESVEQLLGKVLVPAFGAKLLILHGAGREDMDVLMLGKGRPFIAELLLPFKRKVDLKKIEEKVNSSFPGIVSVSDLEFCSLEDVSLLKDSLHDKVYAAFVNSDKDAKLENLKVGEKILVLQRTPSRVAKRRANLERKKEVTVLRVGEISKKEFVLVLRTSHGTYVKEFISGDNGKTVPSVSSLVEAQCSCKLLDVLEVCE